MPDLTVTIPPAVSDRVVDAFLASYPPPPGTDVTSAPAKLTYVRTLLLNQINLLCGLFGSCLLSGNGSLSGLMASDDSINMIQK